MRSHSLPRLNTLASASLAQAIQHTRTRPRSGLQKQVLGLYRRYCRAIRAKELPPEQVRRSSSRHTLVYPYTPNKFSPPPTQKSQIAQHVRTQVCRTQALSPLLPLSRPPHSPCLSLCRSLCLAEALLTACVGQFQEHSTIRRLEIDRIEWLLRYRPLLRSLCRVLLSADCVRARVCAACRAGEKKLKTLQLPGFKGVVSRQL
eukprot:COSAG03_NODE_1596_length_3812_cov_18.509022_6_plen_203_part_00